MNTHDTNTGLAGIWQSVQTYIRLLIEDTRLNVAEKLTRLLSAVALASLMTIIFTVALVFVSIAVGIALAEILSPLWAFVIVAGFYLLLLVALVVFRTALIVNPIARFLSTILLDAPANTPHGHDEPTTLS